jgi:hypothetical protein
LFVQPVDILGSCSHQIICNGSGQQQTKSSTEDDYERAEKAILSAITKVEDKVQKAVAAEVDLLFHGQEKHSVEQMADVTAKANKAVEHGVSKVKRAVDDHAAKPDVYPFEEAAATTEINKKDQTAQQQEQHKDHRILRAVEAAETAVLHAIHDEVDTLFHELEHHDKHKVAVAQAKTTVKEGVQKTTAKVKDIHDHRRSWLADMSTSAIEDYWSQDLSLE